MEEPIGSPSPSPSPPPPPDEHQTPPPQRRRPQSRRPLSRGSLESTLAELGDVCQGVDGSSPWEPEPDSPLRRPYWLLRLIRTTVRHGGFITPRLHVPKMVWEMDRASFSGLSVKTKAFEAILILLLDRVLPLEKPRGPQDVGLARQAQQAFEGVRMELDQLQNQLARPFPFIQQVASSSSGGGSGASSSSSSSSSSGAGVGAAAAAADAGGNSGGGGLNQMQQRFSSMVLSIGKTVKRSAVSAYTAYERIGVAVPSKISDDELVAYSSLVHEVCDKSQSLDAWFVHLDGLRKSSGGGGGVSAFDQAVEQALVELLQCARFFQECVCELLLRDISALLEVYLRKMRKSFARMNYDVEEEDDD